MRENSTTSETGSFWRYNAYFILHSWSTAVTSLLQNHGIKQFKFKEMFKYHLIQSFLAIEKDMFQ